MLLAWVALSIPTALILGRRLRVVSGYLCSNCEIGDHCKGNSRQVCLCSCGDDEEG